MVAVKPRTRKETIWTEPKFKEIDATSRPDENFFSLRVSSLGGKKTVMKSRH
jgi:hypothetical protein